jgi:hypothetical protein
VRAFIGLVTLAALAGCGEDGETSPSPGTTTAGGMGGAGLGGAGVGGGGGGVAGMGGAGTGGQGGEPSVCHDDEELVTPPAECGAGSILPKGTLVEPITPGDVLDLDGFDPLTFPCWSVALCRPHDAATLLFSDEPETVVGDGVLFAEFLEAGQRYRVYVYHVNGGGTLRKFPVVLLNEGASDATVSLARRGVAGPSTSYMATGKAALAAWMTPDASSVPVPAGQRVLLDAELDARHAATDELVHAILELTTDAPLKLSVVSVPAAADAAAVTAGLSVIPSSGLHTRGAFPGADFVIRPVGVVESPRTVSLGSGAVDPHLPGTSLVDGGAAVTLLGNFGASYRVALDHEARVAINPRGGAWAGVASIPATLLLPAGTTAVDDPASAVILGELTEPPLFVSGGGASLPILLMVWPAP